MFGRVSEEESAVGVINGFEVLRASQNGLRRVGVVMAGPRELWVSSVDPEILNVLSFQ